MISYNSEKVYGDIYRITDLGWVYIFYDWYNFNFESHSNFKLKITWLLQMRKYYVFFNIFFFQNFTIFKQTSFAFYRL